MRLGLIPASAPALELGFRNDMVITLPYKKSPHREAQSPVRPETPAFLSVQLALSRLTDGSPKLHLIYHIMLTKATEARAMATASQAKSSGT